MLTKETLIANELLKGLSDEQVGIIETLSRNDEDSVIGERFGKVYRQMDETIERTTGIKRNGDEKTYNYLERATSEYASKYKDYDTLKGELNTLKTKIANGGDEGLKSQVESLTRELASTKEQYTTLKANYDKEKEEHTNALTNYKIENEIARAKEGLKFKGGLNESVLETLVAKAIESVKAKNPSFEMRDGKERLIFHDENGSPLNNAENGLAPFTSKELLIKELSAMDILETLPAKGAGGHEPKPRAKSLASATTQSEASDLIDKMLLDKGLLKTSIEFMDERDRLWRENEIDKLPLR